MSKASRARQFKLRVAIGELRLPTRDEFARKISEVARMKSEWAGIPMPLADFPLTLEPRYPYQGMQDIGKKPEREMREGDIKDYETVNSWFNERKGVQVYIVRHQGKLKAALGVGHNRASMLINTLGASEGWLVEAEIKAMQKLQEMVTEQAFRQYLLTGMFIESSKRSGIYYIFRKLRPTLALSGSTGQMRGLCALCAHSIGYYKDSFCGALTPTDDVVSHLCMMRGDEHFFWRTANQHPFHRHESGL